jgi:hypothetical protein
MAFVILIGASGVVQGAMVQNPGQAPTMLATGTSFLNLRDLVHGGLKVVGPGNVILFTVHTVDNGLTVPKLRNSLTSADDQISLRTRHFLTVCGPRNQNSIDMV